MKKFLFFCQILLLSACGSSSSPVTPPIVAPISPPATNAAPASVGPNPPTSTAPTPITAPNSVFGVNAVGSYILSGETSSGVTTFNVYLPSGTNYLSQTVAQAQGELP